MTEERQKLVEEVKEYRAAANRTRLEVHMTDQALFDAKRVYRRFLGEWEEACKALDDYDEAHPVEAK